MLSFFFCFDGSGGKLWIVNKYRVWSSRGQGKLEARTSKEIWDLKSAFHVSLEIIDAPQIFIKYIRNNA